MWPVSQPYSYSWPKWPAKEIRLKIKPQVRGCCMLLSNEKMNIHTLLGKCFLLIVQRLYVIKIIQPRMQKLQHIGEYCFFFPKKKILSLYRWACMCHLVTELIHGVILF